MNTPANADPRRAPATGTPAYFQSESPLPEIGNIQWAIRSPKSRAGLIGKQVVPPRHRPIAHTTAPTRNGPSPGAGPDVESALEKMAATITTRTKVPRISLSRFAPVLRILGVVQKHARFRNASGV
jgi:hypothetical protein